MLHFTELSYRLMARLSNTTCCFMGAYIKIRVPWTHTETYAYTNIH